MDEKRSELDGRVPRISDPSKSAEAIAKFAYTPERDQALDHNRCFLCGVDLEDEGVSRTDEHVFPKWLLHEFDLWNERINLLNGTDIPYKSMKIPCCAQCNGKWLGGLESEISTAYGDGYEAFAALDPTRLSLWLSKIYYGLLFKEVGLQFDQTGQTEGTIANAETLQSLALLHHLLQAAIGRVRIELDTPVASVFTFKCQVPDEPKLRFNYRDLLVAPFLALRMGEIGVAATLLDWGAVGRLQVPEIDQAKSFELQPLQFDEACSRLADFRIRFNRSGSYLHAAGADQEDSIIVLPLGGTSGKPPFDDFDPEVYSRVYAGLTGIPVQHLYFPERREFWTSLQQPDGSPNYVSLEKGWMTAPGVSVVERTE